MLIWQAVPFYGLTAYVFTFLAHKHPQSRVMGKFLPPLRRPRWKPQVSTAVESVLFHAYGSRLSYAGTMCFGAPWRQDISTSSRTRSGLASRPLDSSPNLFVLYHMAN